MTNKKKALLLASIASLTMLCGCGSNRVRTIETEDGTYIESNGEFVKLNLEPVIFEPGDHIIHYVHIVNDGSSYQDKDLAEGFGNPIFAPEVPEGYKIIGTTSYSNSDGYDHHMIYIMVNDERVEAEGVYDKVSNSVIYPNPGKVVEDLELKK